MRRQPGLKSTRDLLQETQDTENDRGVLKMLTKTKLKMLFIIISVLLELMTPEAIALKLTLSDEGLMALDEYARYYIGLKATILEKRDIEGPGVEFDIYFPGNKNRDDSIYYLFSDQKFQEVFKGVDIASYDAFELKFTLTSVDGNDSPDSGGILIVGAYMNRSYRPEAISLRESKPTSIISTTRIKSGSISYTGFTAHMLSPDGWDPNGTTVTLLIEPVPNAVSVPLPKEDVTTETKGKIIYVDSNAVGANNGSSWTDAFKYLQDGLAEASENDQIWVTEGIYKPDEGKDKVKGDRTTAFVLKKGVAVYGGFPSGGSGREYINPQINKTILSGDLKGNDARDIAVANLLGDPTRNDNCFRVVSGSGTDFNTLLDGFIITSGNANGDSHSSYDKGGGLYCKSGDLNLSNCVLKANSAILGGAMYNFKGDPVLINCTFLLNYADDSGGAVYSSTGSPIFYNCIFGSNHAKEEGGGVYNEYNSPITTNCTFTANIAYAGGGIFCNKSKPIIRNCILWGNSSRYGKLEPSQIYAVESNIDHSCIQGLTIELAVRENFNLDPDFVNAKENNFNLKAGSPCIDAGINDLLPSEINTDVDGTSRLKDGNNDGTAKIDIGAQEFQPNRSPFQN
jgi:predicted outer membrane repeat protein